MFDDEIESLMAPGSQGSFGILKNHAPMITSLDAGILTIKQTNKVRYFTLSSGILEVDHESKVLVLSNAAVESEDLMKAKEQVNELQDIANNWPVHFFGSFWKKSL